MDYGSYIDEINAIVSKKPKKKTQEQIFDKKKNKENKTPKKGKKKSIKGKEVLGNEHIDHYRFK